MPEADRRRARILAGLCVSCGADAPAPGRLSCDAKQRARMAG